MRTVKLYAVPTSAVPLAFKIAKGGLLRHVSASILAGGTSTGGSEIQAVLKRGGTDDIAQAQSAGYIAALQLGFGGVPTAPSGGAQNLWMDFIDLIVQDGENLYVEHIQVRGTVSEWSSLWVLYFEEIDLPTR